MGWTSFRMTGSVKEWFSKEWDYVDSDYEVLDSALVKRNTLYGAVKKKSTGEVFCAVFLIRWSRDYYNFSYKDMTEHSGPCQHDCPKKIMKLLTPLNDENDPNHYARDWRERVENYWASRITMNKGEVIKTKELVHFTNGSEYQYFKKINRRMWAGIMVDNKRQPIYFQPMIMVRINLDNYIIENFNAENLVIS